MGRSTARVVTQATVILVWLILGGVAESQTPRPFYVISDLHFGIGAPGSVKLSTSNPCPSPPSVEGKDETPITDAMRNTEDFRFPVALCGFLAAIGDRNSDGVDLVIAGDFLELWQHPQVDCRQLGAKDVECGCTVEQMKQVVRTVLRAHAIEFAALDRFLTKPTNRLIVVPGNHDAALMDDDIWALVQAALPSAGSRLVRAASGTWFSEKKRVVVEHGHQQQVPEVNAFPRWDHRVVTKMCEGEKRFFVTWGEHFVYALYTDIETNLFPLIDNLVPDSAGTSVYSAHAKVEHRTAKDWARFITFNVLETSLYQKLQILSVDERPAGRLSDTEVAACKVCLRGGLVLRGGQEDPMTPNPLLQGLVAQQGLKDSAEFRAALDEQAAQLPNDQARLLCERVATLGKGVIRDSEGNTCQGTLSTAISKVFDPNGEHMLARRVSDLYDQSEGALQYYIFGHTHEAKVKMPVALPARNVLALNTGAFQRLIDKDNFTKHPKRNKDESDPAFLARLTHEDLAACYSVVEVKYQDRYPQATLLQWFMDENGGQGLFLDACSTVCTAPPANCPHTGP